ncbi:MAG TPA: WYL domain-containing protein, partial [Pseudonocardia sp.]|nr:WYL domain-containing protein [Pseudonocardia sp.]
MPRGARTGDGPGRGHRGRGAALPLTAPGGDAGEACSAPGPRPHTGCDRHSTISGPSGSPCPALIPPARDHLEPGAADDPPTRPDLARYGFAIKAPARAARDRELVTFSYRRRGGTAAARRVGPYRLLAGYGLWWLLAYDLHRQAWRTFRVDRIEVPQPVRHRFTPRPLPAEDTAAYLREGI